MEAFPSLKTSTFSAPLASQSSSSICSPQAKVERRTHRAGNKSAAMEWVWRKAKKAMCAGFCVHLPTITGDLYYSTNGPHTSNMLSLDSTAITALHEPLLNSPVVAASAKAGTLWRFVSGTSMGVGGRCGLKGGGKGGKIDLMSHR
ncbi:hypothetical protein ACP4OV_027921 [Aristida adscensionis]